MYKCVALKQFQRKQQEGATHTKTKLFTYLYMNKENNHYSDYYSKISRCIVIIQLVCVYGFITFIDDIEPLRKSWNSRDNPANIFSIMESVGNFSVHKQRACLHLDDQEGEYCAKLIQESLIFQQAVVRNTV